MPFLKKKQNNQQKNKKTKTNKNPTIDRNIREETHINMTQ